MDLIPENQGRATVYGLTLHSMEISGQTIFLSSNDILPCRSFPIVARLPIDADAEQLRKAVLMVESTARGGCIQVLPGTTQGSESMKVRENPADNALEKVKTFGQRLRHVCTQVMLKQPIVVLVSENYGLVLGNYASNWRQEPFNFVVIDEIPDRQAHFVNIGRLQNTIVPVSFYGVC